MKLAIIGAGQLGYQLYRAAPTAQRLLIDTRPSCPEYFADAELGYTTNLKDAAQCDIVAMAVPPAACQGILETICPVLKAGTIVLNFPTKYLMPQELKDKFPAVKLLESKLLGSAVGLSRGLEHLVILDEANTDAQTAEQVKACLSGLKVTVGDYRIVPKVNSFAMKAALADAIRLEKDLRGQGYGDDVVKAVVGGLMPGSIISYVADTLGEFGRDLVEELRQEEK